jgi:agmatine/peptidylarginine deiminase
LVPLPLPAAIHDTDGKRLPAGYPNFLILNGAVLVPTYGVPQDADALQRLRPCFPDREVIGIDCRALIEQYGSLHCVTMQIPSAAA